MEQLIERVSASAGIEPETARKAIAMILGFLQKEAPPEEMGKVLEAIPGSRDAAASAAAEQSGGGYLAGGGLMGLASQLSGLGLGMGEMQAVGKELFAHAREHAGEDTVGAIAGAVPGLHQLV